MAQLRRRFGATIAIALTSVLVASPALAEGPDTTRPTATLTAPTTAGPFRLADLGVTVLAQDETGLERVVANVYQGTTLVRSAQVAANGATEWTFTPTYTLPDGAYTLRYNAADTSGNISTTRTHDFTIDNTAPTLTIKPESIGPVNGRYREISFKLFDKDKIDKVVLNGVTTDLSNNVWSDLNNVRPGRYGAVEGSNTIVLHDVAGNTTSLTFILDVTGPAITIKPESLGGGGIFREISLKLFDAADVDKVIINGVTKDLTNSPWSDVNFMAPGTFGAVEGLNTLVAYDGLGNTSTFTFALDITPPTVTVKPEMTVTGEGGYESVSFKLYDLYKIDRVVINGVVKDLSNNQWSDVNGIVPGMFGAVLGENTMVVYDVAGNATTVTFTLVTPVATEGPTTPGSTEGPTTPGSTEGPTTPGSTDGPTTPSSTTTDSAAATDGATSPSSSATATATTATATAKSGILASTGSPMLAAMGAALALLVAGAIAVYRRHQAA